MSNSQLTALILEMAMKKLKLIFLLKTLNISFNSKYLIDIASEVEDKNK